MKYSGQLINSSQSKQMSTYTHIGFKSSLWQIKNFNPSLINNGYDNFNGIMSGTLKTVTELQQQSTYSNISFMSGRWLFPINLFPITRENGYDIFYGAVISGKLINYEQSLSKIVYQEKNFNFMLWSDLIGQPVLTTLNDMFVLGGYFEIGTSKGWRKTILELPLPAPIYE